MYNVEKGNNKYGRQAFVRKAAVIFMKNIRTAVMLVLFGALLCACASEGTETVTSAVGSETAGAETEIVEETRQSHGVDVEALDFGGKSYRGCDLRKNVLWKRVA